jgi:hypothetical protein
MSRLIVVDCEAPFGVGSPSVGDMTEFGAVDVNALREGRVETFHGVGCSEDTFKHDHHPVHDALGNAEALIRLFDGER